jgi:hypothetical protein
MPLSKSAQQKAAFVFGIVFVGVLLGIAVLFPNPTPFQYTVFRIVLALASAGIAAMIPGFLHVEVGTAVRAGGAIAVFVVVYFFSPVALPAVEENRILAEEYKRYINRVHKDNREIISTAQNQLDSSDSRRQLLTQELQQLDNLKTAIDETVSAGEQMGAATHRKAYNDKVQELKNTETKNTEVKKKETTIVAPLGLDRLHHIAEVKPARERELMM